MWTVEAETSAQSILPISILRLRCIEGCSDTAIFAADQIGNQFGYFQKKKAPHQKNAGPWILPITNRSVRSLTELD